MGKLTLTAEFSGENMGMELNATKKYGQAIACRGNFQNKIMAKLPLVAEFL